MRIIRDTDDKGLIHDLQALVGSRDTDWFEQLSLEQQHDVLQGIDETDKGETILHAQVVGLFAKWGLK